ncbi:hypothetical protein EXIGLDRAFT_431445 [Exidia glandulosa HHB12029]|uniref:Uncharacterized protein n=1 Tax=Exidia glandulosa HHB12029 TaxID=1314781 RepID=A0A165KGP4_EXIGL|nr:hypothetical protein EXIGLDRAFT_431445 [Exidia glandulosa HHB12029]
MNPGEKHGRPGSTPSTPSSHREAKRLREGDTIPENDAEPSQYPTRPFTGVYSGDFRGYNRLSLFSVFEEQLDCLLEKGKSVDEFVEVMAGAIDSHPGYAPLHSFFKSTKFDHLVKNDADLFQFIGIAAAAKKADNYKLSEEHFKTLLRYLCGERIVAEPSPASVQPLESSRVFAAWKTPFRGDMEYVLLQSIRKEYQNSEDSRAEYGNTVTILQSSGTGKSRMVDEMRHLVFTLPFNLRENNTQLSYPPADDRIRDYMLVSPPIGGDPIAFFHAQYSKLFALLFRSVRFWIQCQQPPLKTYEERVHSWNVFLEKNRDEVYQELISRLQSPTATSSLQASFTELGQLVLTLRGDPKDLPASPDMFVDSLFRQRLTADQRELAKNRLKETSAKFPDLNASGTAPYVVVYVDEAHTLTKRCYPVDALPAKKSSTPPSADASPQPKSAAPSQAPLKSAASSPLSSGKPKDGDSDDLPKVKSLYDVLLSVMNDFRSTDFFGVFLSTSSHISQFAPPRPLVPSSRQFANRALPPPITEVSFDCGPGLPLTLAKLTVEELSSIEFMAQYGRPLFWTMFNDAPAAAKPSIGRDVIRLARNKLLCAAVDDPNVYEVQVGTPHTTNALIAVLDVRLCFDYETRAAVVSPHEADLVASHMRLAYSVPSHRQYFRSGYSSEPILAEAAAQALQEWTTQSKTRSSVPTPLGILSDILKDGIIRRGDRGELVARLLLTRAYDSAMIEKNTTKGGGWLFSEGCTLPEFIQALFVSRTAQDILASKPDNVTNGQSFSIVFANSRVRFTHWAKLGDSSGLSAEGLCAAFIRGMAYIGHPTQEYLDVAIPFLIDADGPIAPHNISALYIQVKARLQPGFAGKYDFTAEQCSAFKSDERHPYCTLLMELGIALSRTTQPLSHVDVSKIPAKRFTRSSVAKADQKVQHRYNIRAYGCSNTVYAIIHEKERDIYDRLLSERDATQDHPRKENLKHVYDMKPVWYGKKHPNEDSNVGIDSYKWISDLHPQPPSPESDDEPQEGVYIVDD